MEHDRSVTTAPRVALHNFAWATQATLGVVTRDEPTRAFERCIERESVMRSITTRKLTAVVGVTVALALSGALQPAAAQSSDQQNGSARQTTPRAKQSSGRTAHARAIPQQEQRQEPVDNSAATNGLPGYSARPEGMCWTSSGGGGQDLAGSWGPCRKK
jgi:hypothetical protein